MYNTARHIATIHAIQVLEEAVLVYHSDSAAPNSLKLLMTAKAVLADMLIPYYTPPEEPVNGQEEMP